MKIGLFIPCYVDQLYPKVAVATLELLEKLGMDVIYPSNQTCCGQPMANSGFEHLNNGCNKLFIQIFSGLDYVVSPSGSCVLHLKEHLQSSNYSKKGDDLHYKIYELSEFLIDILKLENLSAYFPYKVGLHQSCHGQRGLHISQMSELMAPPFSKPEKLLKMVQGVQLVKLDRTDECCGFGGTFCVAEEAVSAKMGIDRVRDHLKNGAEYITSVDMSCLMHIEGILKRRGNRVQVKHLAEILNSQI